MSSSMTGRVVRIGDNVDTDVMVSGAYLNITDREELGAHLFETYDADVASRLTRGDIIVAGKNCGMGSSREHAPLAMLGRGIKAVIAVSFARIFFRNCINLGLPVVEHPEAAAALEDGTQVTIDFEHAKLHAHGDSWRLPDQPPFLAELIQAGGLVPWVRNRLREAPSRRA